ncbi:MAG: hypothetical protein V3U65_08365 [Granulosicoccaceae bacterium]
MDSKVEEVYVTVSIDTECDHDINWARSNPLTCHSINRGLPEILQPAFDQVGAVPTYLLTIEVLEDPEAVKTLRNLKGNFEYGTHLHAGFVEPQKKHHNYAAVDCADFQSSYPPEIEYQKLATITDKFEKEIGYKPTSFRAGRFGASTDTINSLQKLGYKVDTSVTPKIKWVEPNGVVDFRNAPGQPYFPGDSITSAGSSAKSRILEVPVTVKPRLFRRQPKWFRPWFASVDDMKAIYAHHLKKHADQKIVTINMMFHSMEVIEKASPYPQTTDEVKRFVDDMQQVLQWCGEEGAQFCGLSDLHATYQN